MQKLLSCAVLCFTIVAFCVPQARALRILTEISPPAQFEKDGELTGYTVELVREAMRRLGLDQEIEVFPWARAYMMLESDPDIALFATTRTAEREDMFHWAGPISRLKWALYGRKGSLVSIDNIETAKQLDRIGTYHNDAREQFLIKEGFTNLESVNDNVQNVRKLMRDRIQAVASSNIGIRAIAQKAGVDPSELRELLVLKKADLYVAFSQKTDSAVVQQWQQAFDDMRADGTFAAIYTKWLPGEEVPYPAE